MNVSLSKMSLPTYYTNITKMLTHTVTLPPLSPSSSVPVFLRTIEGQTYDGVVKQKEEAQQQYTQAVSRGQSAGIVRCVCGCLQGRP